MPTRGDDYYATTLELTELGQVQEQLSTHRNGPYPESDKEIRDVMADVIKKIEDLISAIRLQLDIMESLLIPTRASYFPMPKLCCLTIVKVTEYDGEIFDDRDQLQSKRFSTTDYWR